MDQALDQSQAPQPLRILTLDGGGLQAISTLLILNKVLEKLGIRDGTDKPRPCDVFDTISGIGVGGWLAILLGRFQMDITSCLSEWYTITQGITPKSRSEEFRLRFLNRYYHTDRLLDQVDRLTNRYNMDKRLQDDAGISKTVRTRYVFVAALESDTASYKLFRSYEIPKSVEEPGLLLEGPQSPESFAISHAFAVTGAARDFTSHWEEQMARSGKLRFLDTRFPSPHSITELALEEMWGIHGRDVPLSIVLNIGPGLPHQSDTNSFRSFKGKDMGMGLRELGLGVEEDIKTKLDRTYTTASGLYTRLAPDEAPQGVFPNDSCNPGTALNAIQDYLKLPEVDRKIEYVVEQISRVASIL